MKKLIVAVMCAMMAGCAAPDMSKETLVKAGFRDIQIDGYAWMGCGKDDTFSTKFTATNALGMRVSGVVCCGTWKGCTVRY